jgi:RHS repeat-associated protein
MKSNTHVVSVLVVVLLATLSSIGFAQADSKAANAQKNNKSYDLKITKAGPGDATVTSVPSGIDCGPSCRAEFNRNTPIALTVTAASGSAFKRWGGACKSTTPTCTVTLKEAQNVTAITDLLPITLNVTKTGTGRGSVTSQPAGIDCGAVCRGSFPQKLAAHSDDQSDSEEHQSEEHKDNDPKDDNHQDHGSAHKPAVVVTLTATPATGSAFTGWSGACTGSETTCTVTLEQTQNVNANFDLLKMPLTTVKTGNGTGTLLSLQTGIDCGATCSAVYDWGSQVTLVATPATGSTFESWSGACAGSTETCTVTLDQAQQISADFALMKMTLTAAKTGSGTGIINSQPSGIDCGATCSATYDWGTQITLTATPSADSLFKGWTGACTGTATTCTVTLDQNQQVSADFAPALRPLSLNKTGPGTGSVTSSPAGIDCGTACSANFTANSDVTLTATPASGSTFTGWFGACTGSAYTCTVTLSQAKTVIATFSAPATTTYEYDANGNLTKITDPLGRIRQVQYDALNQPVRELEPHPTIIGSTLGQIDTTYDSLGQIKSITDPRNLTTSYTVDSLGNLSQQTSPDTGVTIADHDEAGNLITRTDARGKTATYHYDSLNRISQIAYDDQTVSYIWDSCTNGIGRLCSLTNANSTISYRYDSHGRLTQKSQSATTTPLTVNHTYNSAGQRQQTLTPGGQTIDYQWTGNRITAIAVNGQPVISQIGYDPDGQINGWLWGNNQQHERFHNLSGRPVIVSMGIDPQSQLPNSRTYGYDAAGRLTDAIDDSDPSLNQHHEYDELGRLTTSQRGETQLSRTDYAYDLSGNRTEKIQDGATLHSYSTDPASNRLQSQGGAQTVNNSYDAAGNLTHDGTYSHSYNAAGRRIASTHSATGHTTGYGYDALGQRISKTVNGHTVQYFYDEQGHLTGEYDSSGQLIQEILWLGDLPVAVLKLITPTPASPTADLYFIHADHLDTPRKITLPSDNKAVWTWESEAFGNSLPEQNPSGLGNFVFNLRFPGQYYDQETGLHYNMARYYNPKTGRYDESDPIGLAGGINTYAYALNSPLRWVDPLGLYGTQSCSYYDQACAANQGAYECSVAPTLCPQFPNNDDPTGNSDKTGNWSECVRQCLQEKHNARMPNPGQCSNDNNISPGDNKDDHLSCWSGCYKNPENPYNSNGPNLPDGSPRLY